MEQILKDEFGVDVNADYPVHFIRGACIVKVTRETPVELVMPPEKFDDLVASGKVERGQLVKRSSWEIDRHPPLFRDHQEYVLSRW